MDLKSQVSWINRSRLNDIKSQLDHSVIKPKRSAPTNSLPTDQKKTNLNGGTPSSFILSDSKASDYSYYTTIQSFRNYSAMSQLKRSISDLNSPLRSPKKPEKNVFSSAFNKMFPKKPRETSHKQEIDEILTPKMLDKAVNLIRKGKASSEEFSYCRKLRNTCLLLLDSLNA